MIWRSHVRMVVVAALVCNMTAAVCPTQTTVALPPGVRPVWDLDNAYRETTPTRERVSVNGLWRWQPADPTSDRVPESGWGYFKVPGCWPGITDYMQKDSQTVQAHPGWKDRKLAAVPAAWYQREITIPAAWAGRRIAVYAEYLNSYAAVYLDGQRAGEIRFPAGELDISPVCRPETTHVLSMLVVAMPLKGVRLSFNDTNAARAVQGAVARRGLCGDVYLDATPAAARIGDVKVDTSVRNGEMTVRAELQGLAADARPVRRSRKREAVVSDFAAREVRGARRRSDSRRARHDRLALADRVPAFRSSRDLEGVHFPGPGHRYGFIQDAAPDLACAARKSVDFRRANVALRSAVAGPLDRRPLRRRAAGVGRPVPFLPLVSRHPWRGGVASAPALFGRIPRDLGSPIRYPDREGEHP